MIFVFVCAVITLLCKGASSVFTCLMFILLACKHLKIKLMNVADDTVMLPDNFQEEEVCLIGKRLHD